ncbi:MAG: enoyl-CoA hydratase/isomerase family protein [Herpetosiphonaceae bacterium]|nr:enoyl-CoA hydratase/isomerase family protein [Herpetosiphonaceae bacterium]
MTFTNIEVTHAAGVSTITLNRPKQLNALDAATISELSTALTGISSDTGVRAIILTGSGERAFAAGADIGELRELQSATAAREMALRSQGLGRLMSELHQPIIAAINGYALGGGLELALACDIRIAADTAQLGLPEVTLGILPGWGGTQRLARLIGPGMAKLMMMTGERIKANEALRLGLVERVVPAAELAQAAQQLAQQIAALPPLSIAAIKQAVNQGLNMSLDQGNAFEAGLFGELAMTADAKEGTTAFLDKRAAVWQGK